MGNGTVLGLVGSPNPGGRTNELVMEVLEGAARAGAPTELVQISEHVMLACRDCLAWVCSRNLKGTYEDAGLKYLDERLQDYGALVLGSPVYYHDTSAMVRYLILKMFRIYPSSGWLHGLPALGIAVAGGTGNGLVSGLKPLYHCFYIMPMRAIAPFPVTRFNYGSALHRAREVGAEIGQMAGERRPFAGLQARILWYRSLPYLGFDRAAERRVLAELTTAALPDGSDASIAEGLARAQALADAGDEMGALAEITGVYNAGATAFDSK